MDTASTRSFLLDQQARYPLAALQDLRKALYQSVFGCGHLITDPSAAAAGIRAEYAESGCRLQAPEPLDGPWARVPLGVLRSGLTPETLAATFARSAAMPHGEREDLDERLSVLTALAEQGALPYPDAGAEIAVWRSAGFPACRHSQRFRDAYHPAYRVLHTVYVRLLPLLAALDRTIAEKGRVVLAIEGGAGSGKTTLAETLAGLYPGATVFHADDFFPRPEQRTAERLAQPGGNLDRERLEEEILRPLRRGETVTYRPFDCGAMTLKAPVTVCPGPLNIVEGSYSFHPALAAYYDLSVFLDITPEAQRRRILARNGPEWAAAFFQRWIPLENTYFRATDTANRCSLRLPREEDRL